MKTTALTLIATLVLLSSCAELAKAETMKLDLNLNDWQTTHASNVPDTWSVRIVDGDAAHAPALDFQRGNSQDEGGSAGATRKLNLPVTKYGSLVLKADVKVLDYTLRGSGWWYDLLNVAVGDRERVAA